MNSTELFYTYLIQMKIFETISFTGNSFTASFTGSSLSSLAEEFRNHGQSHLCYVHFNVAHEEGTKEVKYFS